MKNLLLLTLLLLLCGALLADISEYYEFSAATGTYTEITGTAVPTAQGDDVITAALDIGFTFPYGSNSYTQIKISSNGVIALGTTASPSLSNTLNSTSLCPVVAAIWDDLHTGRVQDATYPQTSSVQTLLSGTAPNREFTIQYKNAYWYYSASTSWVNFQIVLKENGNVELRYGPNAATSPSTSASASIGINILPGGASNYWSVTPGNPATASNTVENATINAYIPAGTIYSFIPPVATLPPNPALIVSPMNGATDVSNFATLNWSSGGGLPANYDVYFGTSPTPPMVGNQVGTTYNPGNLTYLQTYYWKIVPHNANGTASNCPTWSFTVMSDPSIVTFPYNYGFEGAYPPAGWVATTVSGSTGIQQMASMTSPTASPHGGGFLGYYNSYSLQAPSNAWIATPPMNCTGGDTYMYTVTFWMYRDPGYVGYDEGYRVYSSTTQSLTGATLLGTVHRAIDMTPVVPSAGWYSYTFNIGDGNTGTRYIIFNAYSAFGNNMAIDDISIVRANLTNPPNPAVIVSPADGATLVETMAPLNWADGGGFPTSYDVYFGTTLPATPNANVATTSWTPPTMNWNTTYSWKIAPRNVNGVATNCPTWSFTTRSDPTITTSPYVQNFDTVTPPALPIDWYRITSGTASVNTVTTTPHSNPNCVYINNSSATDGPYLISPPIATALPINTMRIRFWAKGATTYHLNVGMMTNPLDAATFTSTQDITLTAAWAEYVVGFQTYTGAGHYMAIKHGNAATYQSIYVDDVSIEVIATNDLAAVSVAGNTTPSVGIATTYSVNLFNWGTAVQNAYTVKLMSGTTELTSVAGPAIQPGMAATASLIWSPTTQGPTTIFGKVVLTGDQNIVNDVSPELAVSVQPAGTMVVTIGDGSQTARMPMDMYYKNSLNETIYLQTELNFIGSITGIALFNNFADDRQNMPTKIWMGTTTQTDLSGGWIPSTNLTQVFDGNVNYPIGQNTINITFTTPFLYLEGNLVVMFNRPMDTAYYSSLDYFYCQTIGTNRALNIYNDLTTFDPAAPPTGTVATGQFAKTAFFIIPGGVGHLTGTVTGAGAQPLDAVSVQILNGASTTTNAVGHYEINNLIAGDYQVTYSRNGYISQTLNVTIAEDQTLTQNVTLVQMTTVNITGTIVGSDAPTVGLAGAVISFTGYEDYTVTANAAGQFTVTGVYANQTYDYYTSFAGYQARTGEAVVGAVNLDMGNVILSEIAFSPRAVTAAANAEQSMVTVTWQAPDPNTADVASGFEAATFPPADWSRVVTDNGPPNASGVYPTWCRFGTVTSGADVIAPAEGDWQAGFWYSFSHQDEWLITPQFNCPQGGNLTFESNVFLGSANGDHYYVKASTDNGNTWTVLWDASTLTGGWNNYDTPITIDLAQFTGQQIKVAWHADDPNASSDGMWYVWFIDNVSVGNATTRIKFPESSMLMTSANAGYSRTATLSPGAFSKAGDSYSRTLSPVISNQNTTQHTRHVDRSLVGYKVWRLPQGQEQNETVWSLLTPAVITALTMEDNGWLTLEEGTYKWAVKAYYTNDVASLAIFSNPVVRPVVQMGTLAGSVRNMQNQPIGGATITVGTLTATTAANGGYVLPLPVGMHTVTCTATGYVAQTQANIEITVGQTTVTNFNLQPVANEDEVAVSMTVLKGNYPNPFNPNTTLSFDVKDRAPVRIDIYNMKGQLIRTLVNETKATGHYTVNWNGTDNHGKAVASGVYHYRMQAGDYKATRRMMLMK